MKENLCFKQLWLNYINKKKKKKEHIRLVTSSVRVGLVSKTDDEVNVLSTIKIRSYFLYVFCTVPKKLELLKISQAI